MSILGSVTDMDEAQKVNWLQFFFMAMWKQAEGDPAARKMLTDVAEAYNRRMAEINGRR
jgi:hypothetical protein